MRIAFDFDGTLSEDRILDFADTLKNDHELWICTFRYAIPGKGIHPTNDDIYEVAELLNIPKTRILFTNHEFTKGELLSKNKIGLFLDDWDEMVIDAAQNGVPSTMVGEGDIERMEDYINKQKQKDEEIRRTIEERGV